MKAEVTNGGKVIIFPNDDVVCPKFIGGIVGGRVLDVSEVEDTYIKAGQLIITDGNGTYKPLKPTDGAYTTVPSDWSICGVLYRTVPKERPWASIMTSGRLNSEAAPYPVTPVEAAFKAALPLVELVKDEEA